MECCAVVFFFFNSCFCFDCARTKVVDKFEVGYVHVIKKANG